MRRISRLTIMLVLAMLAGQQLQAKKHPFVMEGKKLVYINEHPYKRITYLIKGDTLINEAYCMKMFRSVDDGESVYHGAVSEEGAKAYIVFANETEKKMIYDCSEHIDDLVKLACGLTLEAYTSMRVEIDGEPYNFTCYYYLPNNDGVIPLEVNRCLEGFGCLDIDFLSKDPKEARSHILQSCSENGTDMSEIVLNCDWLPEYVEPTGQKTSMVKEGKAWNYRAEDSFGDGYDIQFFIEGDTLIGGEAYKKLYTIDEPRYNTTEPVYCGALREERTEESIAVDFVRAGHENPEMLYNFSPLLGDKYYYGESYGTVADLDEIEVRGVKRNRIKVVATDAESPWPEEEDATGYWVEGIGSSAGLLTPIDFLTTGHAYTLQSCIEDGQIVFTGADFAGSGNAPTGVNVGEMASKKESNQVCDLQGRKMAGPSRLSRGVYVVNGKKYVVR